MTKTIIVGRDTPSLKARHKTMVTLKLNATGHKLRAKAKNGRLKTQFSMISHQVVLQHKNISLRRSS